MDCKQFGSRDFSNIKQMLETIKKVWMSSRLNCRVFYYPLIQIIPGVWYSISLEFLVLCPCTIYIKYFLQNIRSDITKCCLQWRQRKTWLSKIQNVTYHYSCSWILCWFRQLKENFRKSFSIFIWKKKFYCPNCCYILGRRFWALFGFVYKLLVVQHYLLQCNIFTWFHFSHVHSCTTRRTEILYVSQSLEVNFETFPNGERCVWQETF